MTPREVRSRFGLFWLALALALGLVIRVTLGVAVARSCCNRERGPRVAARKSKRPHR